LVHVDQGLLFVLPEKGELCIFFLVSCKYLWDKSFHPALHNSSPQMAWRSESCPSITYAQSSKRRGENLVSVCDAREQFRTVVEIFQLKMMNLEILLWREFVDCLHVGCDQNSWLFLGEALLCVRLDCQGLRVNSRIICLRTLKVSSEISKWRNFVLFSGIVFRYSVLSYSTVPPAVG